MQSLLLSDGPFPLVSQTSCPDRNELSQIWPGDWNDRFSFFSSFLPSFLFLANTPFSFPMNGKTKVTSVHALICTRSDSLGWGTTHLSNGFCTLNWNECVVIAPGAPFLMEHNQRSAKHTDNRLLPYPPCILHGTRTWIKQHLTVFFLLKQYSRSLRRLWKDALCQLWIHGI